MKQVLIKGGNAIVTNVPSPMVQPRNILVRVEYSCISVGTEMAGVKMSGLPIYKRALKQPENVGRVLEMVRDEGLKRTMDRVSGKLAAGSPTGYSAAGFVTQIGTEVAGFSVGDRVACAGAGVANHAEFIDVPVNLAVRLPDDVAMEAAATVTLGAIAMQGIRRAQPALGENVVVIGLGILGQLTVQMLLANGCRVIGVDLDEDRIRIAKDNGLHVGLDPNVSDYTDRVFKCTDGVGADCVIITAATDSDDVISSAMHASRKKGRVILVGDVGLGLNRADFYKKELDFLISTSYGPGRYDSDYEELGLDYPISYVRWTENRNMQAYIDLLARRKITLDGLTGDVYPIDDAAVAYESLKEAHNKPLLVLLSYPIRESSDFRKVKIRASLTDGGRIRVALAGASSFAQGVHLPNLISLRDSYELRAVMSRTGANARAVATQFKAEYCTTDFDEIIRDECVDLIMIATRHDLHGSMVVKALEAGKNVFVEKPLTIYESELDEIATFCATTKTCPLLMVGFNRRFSPAIEAVQSLLKDRLTPMIINYTMNAGFIPNDHWVQGSEGGGRNLGEACHIYDLFNCLCGDLEIDSIGAMSIDPDGKQWNKNDNFVASIKYVDGSVCTLTYTAMGSGDYPKERMEIFADGFVITLEDYKSVIVHGSNRPHWKAASPQKGQRQELESLARSLLSADVWPIPLDAQIQASRTSLEVEKQICSK